MLLRARTVLPITREPIADGAVRVRDGRITAVGRWADLRRSEAGPALDLGDVALLPGLINAHCHLEYTSMAGLIRPQPSFSAWVKSIISLKAQWSYSEFAESWLRGAAMLLETGTTTVANIQSSLELLPEVLEATPLRVISFLEIIGLRDAEPAACPLQRAMRRLHSLRWGRFDAGLSPHAPYTTTPRLREAAARHAAEHGCRVTMHVAESSEEFEMFMRGNGPMHRWLRSQRDMDDCAIGSPVQAVARAGLLSERFLAVHVNYLWHNDATLLGGARGSVVHCPNSHAYFGHSRFPRGELTQAGVNLCLGTDSLASTRAPRGGTPVLSLFDEMRALMAVDSTVSPKRALEMATANGARALGLAGRVGELAEGAEADLIAVRCDARMSDAEEHVVHHSGPVERVMIGGGWRRGA